MLLILPEQQQQNNDNTHMLNVCIQLLYCFYHFLLFVIFISFFLLEQNSPSLQTTYVQNGSSYHANFCVGTKVSGYAEKELKEGNGHHAKKGKTRGWYCDYLCNRR